MDLRLIYVNKIGYNHKGRALFEFIFIDADKQNIFDAWGEGWESEPACGNAQPPNEEFIDSIIELSVYEYDIFTIGENEHYSVYDSIQGVIALAYELVDDDYPYDERLVFHYGDTLEEVEELLKGRKLEYNFINDGE